MAFLPTHVFNWGSLKKVLQVHEGGMGLSHVQRDQGEFLVPKQLLFALLAAVGILQL